MTPRERELARKRKTAKARYAAKRRKKVCVQTGCRKRAAEGKTRCKACAAWLVARVAKVKRRKRAGVTSPSA